MKQYKLVQFLEKIHENNRYSLSPLNIYFNECGRLIENKLPKFETAKHNQLVIDKLKSYLKYEWYNLSSVKLKKYDCIIYLSEISHLKEYLPLYELLKTDYSVVFLTIKINILAQLKVIGLPYLPINLRYTLSGKRSRKSKEIIWPNSQEEVEFPPIISDFIKSKRASSLFQQELYNSLLKKVRPKFIFVGNDLTPEGRLFTVLSNRNRIASFSIQHGNIYNNWINRYHVVDCFFSYGKLGKDIIDSSSVNEIEVYELGSLFMRSLRSTNIIELGFELIKQKYSLDFQYTLVAFSGPGDATSYENYHASLRLLTTVILENPEDQFVIKLHKKESADSYGILKDCQNVRLIEEFDHDFNRRYSIFPWLRNASKFITGSSTSALEALYMSIPVISIDVLKEYESFDFIRFGAIISVDNISNLRYAYNNARHLQSKNTLEAEALLKENFGEYNLNDEEILLGRVKTFIR